MPRDRVRAKRAHGVYMRVGLFTRAPSPAFTRERAGGEGPDRLNLASVSSFPLPPAFAEESVQPR